MELDRAIDAVDDAHRGLRLARAQLADELDAAGRRWMKDNADVLDEFDDDDYPFAEQAMEALFENGAEDGVLPERHLERLGSSRQQALELVFQRCGGPIDFAAERVRGAYAAFTPVLEAWLEQVRAKNSEAAGWPDIVKAWRKALNLTARQAAEVLGLSASAIVRYEQGARSPSLAQLASSVQRMIDMDPTVEDESITKLRRGFAIVWPNRDAVEVLDEFEIPQHEKVGRIEELLPGCNSQQLYLISLIAEDKAIATALSQVAVELSTEPLRTAIARLARPQMEASR